MGRPKLPRAKACIFCGGDLYDPRLEAPSRLGSLLRYHYRCYNKRRRKEKKEERRAKLAWENIRPGYRVRTEDYRKTNGSGSGHARKLVKREKGLFTKQTCACGKKYIGGPAAVRCQTCQTEHTRDTKRRWWLRNKERGKKYVLDYWKRRTTQYAAVLAYVSVLDCECKKILEEASRRKPPRPE